MKFGHFKSRQKIPQIHSDKPKCVSKIGLWVFWWLSDQKSLLLCFLGKGTYYNDVFYVDERKKARERKRKKSWKDNKGYFLISNPELPHFTSPWDLFGWQFNGNIFYLPKQGSRFVSPSFMFSSTKLWLLCDMIIVKRKCHFVITYIQN